MFRMASMLALVAAAWSLPASAQGFYARQRLSGVTASSPPVETTWGYADENYWRCPGDNGLYVIQYSAACFASTSGGHERTDDAACRTAKPAPVPALPSDQCQYSHTRRLM